ncbi:DUF4256 domain-containing protein [Gramella sp. GC03-9]|uniref:DUF4256 domain-containing protein n=1 Tax=Christiangramia oceanisediminis TaxID=2920386 RepID=A0A9X2KWU3_9FLAO|nr:DUF4256 domain-containing protein [Gramella oceanisediminis]MCP9199978.1 DUF4256 domain-containing protein [Gramella oceanisediminis]
MTSKRSISDSDSEAIIKILKDRFNKAHERFPGLDWALIQKKLEQNPGKLWSIIQMERTGGEPDLLDYDKDTNQLTFCDFSRESPKDRRSLCYDQKALESRKKFKPKDSAMGVALNMEVELMTEAQYRKLQRIDNFDTKTSSWLQTPEEIRELGGAIFGDFRYGRVFIYHNGVESYYAARGFRAMLKI